MYNPLYKPTSLSMGHFTIITTLLQVKKKNDYIYFY